MASLRFPNQILYFFHFFLLQFASYCSSLVPLCNYDQSSALLHFKNSFHLDRSASVYEPSHPKTKSWQNGTNCCLWDGVTCDGMSGRVIGLDLSSSWLRGTFHSNSSLFQLRHLQKLNLADNAFLRSPISSQFGELVTLKHLNLSYSVFDGEIPSQISQLSKLVSLDFSKNSGLRLEPSTWNKLIQNVTNLRELNLDDVNMSSIRPTSLSLLTNLSSTLVFLHLSDTNLQGNLANDILFLPNFQELDLSRNPNIKVQILKSNWSTSLMHLYLSGTIFSREAVDSISHLKYLNFLGLDFSNFQAPNLLLSLRNFAQMTYLSLRKNNFSDQILPLFSTLQHLTYLDLSMNNFSGEIPSWLSNLQHLTYLDLSGNNFSGEIPSWLSNLQHLTLLYLSSNNLGGSLPPSLFGLTQLSSLDCSDNRLIGPIPRNISRFSILKLVFLSDNLLNGTIPSWCFSLPSLLVLDLDSNQLTGNIVEFSTYSLRTIYLSQNKLQGNIPKSMFDLLNLTQLYLSSNNLSGQIDFHEFSRLQKLEYLDISNNNFLSFNFNNNVDYTIPNLLELTLSSCNIYYFPKVLAQLQNLKYLDLSENNIHGSIPNWFNDIGDGSLQILDLSYNHLTSVEHLQLWNKNGSLQSLDLSHNRLTSVEHLQWWNKDGSLRLLDLSYNHLTSVEHLQWWNMEFVDLSFNKLTGGISSGVCNASSLNILNLSHNNLTGLIPPCLGTLPSLSVLDLQMNNLQGTIPDNFSKRNMLQTLKLNGNNLVGPLPQSLTNSEQLEVLDLANNSLKDAFPNWLDGLQKLEVLILRANKFHGAIAHSKSEHPFPKLRIFDISNNYFNGSLPTEYIENFEGMITCNDCPTGLQYMRETTNYSYYDSVVITVKGSYIEMERILVTFTTIDLSNNMFEGDIPTSIGQLYLLKGLNLSHNKIRGAIPKSVGGLKNLEWLDLSSNMLGGRIPLELSNLNFLSFLNLSQNQLVGIIPLGGQFNTFLNDSYEDNSGLCGFPLSKICGNDDGAKFPPSATFHNEEESGFGWKAVAVGYGCGVVFGVLLGYIVFSTGKPQWLVRIVEDKQTRRVKGMRSRARTKVGRLINK